MEAQPLFALLCAIARDPILKATAEMVLAVPAGETVTPPMMMQAVQASFADRYNPTTLASISRNTISSWNQAGLLQGKLHKVRVKAQSHSASSQKPLLGAIPAGC